MPAEKTRLRGYKTLFRVTLPYTQFQSKRGGMFGAEPNAQTDIQ